MSEVTELTPSEEPMSEPVVSQEEAFATLQLNPTETLLVFQALRLLLRHYSRQESEPLENIQQVAALMATIKPGAIEASRLFAQKGEQNERRTN
jgi:hypothetical protein